MEMERQTNKEWAGQYGSMTKWFAAYPDSEESYASTLRQWHRWLNEERPDGGGEPNGGLVASLSPDELVDWQERAMMNGSSRQRYLLLDKALGFLQAHPGRWRQSYHRKIVTTIRSFFDTNRTPLPEDKTLWRKLRNIPHVDEAPENFIEELETLRLTLLKCNKMYRAVFMSMVAGSLGPGELIEWSCQGLESIEPFEFEGVRLMRIDLPSRKGNNKAWYTVIGGDALRALDEWLELRERKARAYEARHGEPYPDGVFVTANNTSLTKDSTMRIYWLRKLDQLGIIDRTGGEASTRYGYHMHQLRDVFSTLVHGKMDKDVREFMMGHTVDANKYDQFYRDPEKVYGEYVKGLVYLNLLSSDLPFGKADARELERMVLKAEAQGRRIAELEAQLASVTPIGAEVARLLKDPIVVETLKAIAERGKPREA